MKEAALVLCSCPEQCTGAMQVNDTVLGISFSHDTCDLQWPPGEGPSMFAFTKPELELSPWEHGTASCVSRSTYPERGVKWCTFALVSLYVVER
jgi:hypothetical protein